MIDLIASQPHYWAHLDPVWAALPVRGDVIDRRAARTPRRNAVLLASGADLRHARNLGYTRIALLEHGIGQSYIGVRSPSYPGAPGRDAVSLFLSPNATASARDRVAYPKARHVIVGDPVVDTLPRREGSSGRTVAISFHWSWDGVPEMRSAFPHYRDVVPELARQFHVIGHAHPRMAGSLQRFYRKAGIEFVPSFADVCRRADVYVCDNSSTLYEFASTGRPVVGLNAPWFRRNVQHGLRFWEAADVGVNVDRAEDLVAAVSEALTDAPSRQEDREEALQLVYGLRHNGAEATVTALMDWLGSRVEAAA